MSCNGNHQTMDGHPASVVTQFRPTVSDNPIVSKNSNAIQTFSGGVLPTDKPFLWSERTDDCLYAAQFMGHPEGVRCTRDDSLSTSTPTTVQPSKNRVLVPDDCQHHRAGCQPHGCWSPDSGCGTSSVGGGDARRDAGDRCARTHRDGRALEALFLWRMSPHSLLHRGGTPSGRSTPATGAVQYDTG